MFAFLLLVATLSFDFSVKAEDQDLNEPPKCNETIINQIYTYWQNNGGVPQQINENVSTYRQAALFRSSRK